MTISPTTPASDHPAPQRRTRCTDVAETVTVLAWRDATVEQAAGAVPTDSDEAVVWWTPSIGTTGMAIAHRLARYASGGPSVWTIEDIARTFGLGVRQNRVRRSFNRLERFGIVRCTSTTVQVRLWLPPLTFAQRSRLPAYLADAYGRR